jgi:hypothetical protein
LFEMSTTTRNRTIVTINKASWFHSPYLVQSIYTSTKKKAQTVFDILDSLSTFWIVGELE